MPIVQDEDCRLATKTRVKAQLIARECQILRWGCEGSTYGREAFSDEDGHVVDNDVGDICALLDGSGKGEGGQPREDDS